MLIWNQAQVTEVTVLQTCRERAATGTEPYSTVISLLQLVAVCVVLAANASAADRPNVLFIAIDDLNNWAAGLSSYEGALTPNIDRLAERGVLFTNAHCAAPACNPSRASVMTGVAPTTSGVYYNSQDWRECRSLSHVVTLPEHFRQHGYTVKGGGKLYHAANLSEWALEGYLDADAWDEYFPSKTRQLPDQWVPPNHSVNGSNKFYKGRLDWDVLDIDDDAMGDGKVVSWAERQLARQHDKPLFLGVGIYRPHIPWYTPRRWFDKHPLESVQTPKTIPGDLQDVPDAGRVMARRTWHEWLAKNSKWREAVQAYLASVSFADEMVGRLIDALDNGPHANNTIVVLWSDHGYHLGHKQHWEKFALWNQTTQVPLVIVRPDSQITGHCQAPVSLLDIYPTLAGLCQLPPQTHLNGQSLEPFLHTPELTSDRVVVTTQGPGNHAAQSRHWRYIRYEDGTDELYDHQTDPHEFHNLAAIAAHNSVKVRLSAQLPQTNAPLNPVIGSD